MHTLQVYIINKTEQLTTSNMKQHVSVRLKETCPHNRLVVQKFKSSTCFDLQVAENTQWFRSDSTW